MSACDKPVGISWPVWNALTGDGCEGWTPLPPVPAWPRHVLARDVLD